MKTIPQFLKFSGIMCFMLTTVAFVSCSDDSDEKNDSSGNSEIVGVWTKVKEESREGNAAWQNVTEDCDLDDTEEYEAGGKWALYPGTVTCGSAAVVKGSWTLKANNTKVVFSYDAFEGEFESNIEELTKNRMVLTHSAGDVDDTQYRDTYIKQ